MAKLAAGSIVESATGATRLVRQIARGPMGDVWEGDLSGQRVAVKFLQLSRQPELVAHFEDDVAVSAKFEHPNVVRVLDHGIAERETPFLLELFQGESLEARLRRGNRLPLRTVERLLVQIASALDAIHDRKMIHRDIKPTNILLGTREGGQEWVKLADLGLVGIRARLAAAGVTTTPLEALGTPLYMSPEQIAGPVVDHHADLWALAVVVYRALTGDEPFNGKNPRAVFESITAGKYLPPTEIRKDIPSALDAWFARAFAADIALRFHSGEQMSKEFLAASQAQKEGSGASGDVQGESREPLHITLSDLKNALSGQKGTASLGNVKAEHFLQALSSSFDHRLVDLEEPGRVSVNLQENVNILTLGKFPKEDLVDSVAIGTGLERSRVDALLEIVDNVVRPKLEVGAHGKVVELDGYGRFEFGDDHMTFRPDVFEDLFPDIDLEEPGPINTKGK